MKLEKLARENFALLEKQWAEQCLSFEENYEDYAPERIDHARTISWENPPDRRYGIYALKDSDQFEALIHVNRANIPGPPGWTLRMLWMLVAPKYDFREVGFEVLSKVFSGIIAEAVEISRIDIQCTHLKIHLGNLSDRQFFAGVASGLKMNNQFSNVQLVGNWFLLSHV